MRFICQIEENYADTVRRIAHEAKEDSPVSTKAIWAGEVYVKHALSQNADVLRFGEDFAEGTLDGVLADIRRAGTMILLLAPAGRRGQARVDRLQKMHDIADDLAQDASRMGKHPMRPNVVESGRTRNGKVLSETSKKPGCTGNCAEQNLINKAKKRGERLESVTTRKVGGRNSARTGKNIAPCSSGNNCELNLKTNGVTYVPKKD